MATTATQGMSEEQINQLNATIRSQPWYQQWFKDRGLNPNQVQLNSKQRQSLAQVAAQNGFELGGRMKIDEAGNINQMGGFAGMPTWAKVAIAAAPAAATLGFGAAGMGPAAGLFGTSAVPNAVPAVAGSLAPSLPATPGIAAGSMMGGASAAGAGGSVFSKISDVLKNPMVQAGGRALAGSAAAQAANRGAESSLRMDRDALGLQRDQLKLAAEKAGRDAQSDAMNKALWGQYVQHFEQSQRPEGTPSRIDNSISEEAKASGRTLYEQAKALMDSGQYTNVNPQISDFEDYPTSPGLMERIASYGAPAMTLFDPRLYQKGGR